MADNGFLFISVIVPVYNGEKIISGCIESILDQDYPKDRYEIIIVDNGSTDGTRKMVERCQGKVGSQVSGAGSQVNSEACNLKPGACNLKYIYEPKRGSYMARNAGIRIAKGEILAFTDSDCVADKDWLKDGLEEFNDHAAGCVAGRIGSAKPDNYIQEYLAGRDALSHQRQDSIMPLPYAKTANAFYRKEAFTKIGLFEEDWPSGGDADLCWRAREKAGYKIKFSTKALVWHRHRNSLSGMAGQSAVWGMGATLLYKKYRPRIKGPSLKQSLFNIVLVLSSLFIIVPFFLKDKNRMPKAALKGYLDKICFIGWQWGRILGSLKNRVFYI